MSVEFKRRLRPVKSSPRRSVTNISSSSSSSTPPPCKDPVKENQYDSAEVVFLDTEEGSLGEGWRDDDGFLPKEHAHKCGVPDILIGGGGGGRVKDKKDEGLPGEEEEEEEEKDTLPQDVYSLLMLVPRLSSSTTNEPPKTHTERCHELTTICLVILLWHFQMVIFVIVGFELFSHLQIDDGHYIYPFNQPMNVDTTTRVAQCFALVIAVAMQDDVISSVLLVMNQSLRRRLPAPSFWFLTSCVLKWVSGMMGLFLEWVLVVQSSSSVQLFSEFAGMAFVNELDDVFFRLAHGGFFTVYLQHKARRVKEFGIPQLRPGCARFLPRLMTMLVFTAMIVPWAYFTSRQARGDYYAPRIVVRIGDELNGFDGFHSGLYEYVEMKEGHPIYQEQLNPHDAYEAFGIPPTVEEARDVLLDMDYFQPMYDEIGSWPRGHFGYCRSRLVWTYYEGDISDPCTDVVFRSERTMSYDITDAAPSDWVVEALKVGDRVSSAASQIAVPEFALSEHECRNDRDCNHSPADADGDGNGGVILAGGTCDMESGGVCRCNAGYVGIKCEFTVCRTLKQDTFNIPGDGDASISIAPSTFEPVIVDGSLLAVYSRPVFVSWNNSSDSTVKGEDQYPYVMIFTGRRWVIDEVGKEYNTPAALKDFLLKFHGLWTTFPQFVDGFTLMSEPSDAANPAGLRWTRLVGFKEKRDKSVGGGGGPGSSGGRTKGVVKGRGGYGRVSTSFTFRDTELRFVCADCADTDINCGEHGTCGEESGVCECIDGYSGHECDKPPLEGKMVLYLPNDDDDDDELGCGVCETLEHVDLSYYSITMRTGLTGMADTVDLFLDLNDTHVALQLQVGPFDSILPCSHELSVLDRNLCIFNWFTDSTPRNIKDSTLSNSAEEIPGNDTYPTPGNITKTILGNIKTVATFRRSRGSLVFKKHITLAVGINATDVELDVDVDGLCRSKHQIPRERCDDYFWYVNHTRAYVRMDFRLNGHQVSIPHINVYDKKSGRQRQHTQDNSASGRKLFRLGSSSISNMWPNSSVDF